MQLHHTDRAPAAIGHCSQAVSFDGWLYTSGQVGLDPATGELVAGGFEAQARQVFLNLQAVLASAGCDFTHIVNITIYLTDLADLATLNAISGEAMGSHLPTRSTAKATALPKGALVEIDAIAKIPSRSAQSEQSKKPKG
jgi:2-iminobutanoate/2-iminopropanoate deaminase